MRFAVIVLMAIACGPTTNVKRVVIDCTIASQPQIENLLLEFRQILVGEAPNWQAVLDKAIAAGTTIGGCALAELVQSRQLAPTAAARSSAPEGERTPSTVLEEFRQRNAPGTTYRTAKGDV